MRKLTPDHNLAAIRPDVAALWHTQKNGSGKPDDELPTSRHERWWKCSNGHVWQMPVVKMYERRKDLCRQCKSLAFLRPDIAAQWHSERNGDLNPDDINAGSKKKVWWQCPEGPDHEWPATIGSRTARSRTGYCPFCSGRKVSSNNSLAITHPELAAEWHPTKNGGLTPKDVRPGAKREVWWQCPKVADHEYPMPVQSRTAKRYPQGCPYCSRRKLRRDMSLGAVYPDVSAEWHKTRNGDLSPFDVAPGNKRKIWWQCKLYEEHVWPTTPLARTTMGSGCPDCADTGFNPSEPGLLYYIAVTTDDGDTRYKIGITNSSVEKRFPAPDLARIRIVETWRYAIGRAAAEREAEILRQYAGDRYYGPDILVGAGNTELFTHDILGLDK